MAAERPLVLVSNRGPVTFRVDEETGELRSRRGAGGLVSGLAPLVEGTGVTWIAAALGDGDRAAAAAGPRDAEGFRVRTLALDPDLFRAHYDVVCNGVLWFVHHHLFELARRPRLDHRFGEAWDAYRAVNGAFADAVVADAPEGALVLVQDYHLCLTAPRVRHERPDLRLVHFSHTPFAVPDLFGVLPDAVGRELLDGLAAHHACGFHTRRWAEAFTACCHAVRGGADAPTTFVSPLAPDPADLAGVASSAAATEAGAALAERVGDRELLVRVDRIELSKNLLRGFLAFDELLERYPRWRDRVCFAASVYPSREGLPEYLAYRQEVEGLVARINERWAEGSWTPILLDTSDHFPSSVATLAAADVLLVNPVRDGLNLVAKEAALVNDRDGVLVLSTEAGAWEELGDAALRVNPFDVAGTADALDRALGLAPAERAELARRWRTIAATRTPADWLAEQRAAGG